MTCLSKVLYAGTSRMIKLRRPTDKEKQSQSQGRPHRRNARRGKSFNSSTFDPDQASNSSSASSPVSHRAESRVVVSSGLQQGGRTW